MPTRISSGIYKNKRLKTIPGKEFRPISEKIKLALFSILGDKINGSNFADLFAGVGNVGLEALSRGAEYVVFVEKARDKIELIKHNVTLLGVDDTVQIAHSDVFDFNADLNFDIVFAGPPYKINLGTKIMQYLRTSDFINRETIIILQHHYKENIDSSGYNRIDKRKYGITELDFFVIHTTRHALDKDNLV